MTVQDLLEKELFRVLNEGDGKDQKISRPFCCDLLSIAMSKAPEGAAWVTVMGNINTLAVATLADCACIILAEGVAMDENALEKARNEGITVLASEQPIFESANAVMRVLESGE